MRVVIVCLKLPLRCFFPTVNRNSFYINTTTDFILSPASP